jgi:hypothetical protein
LAFPPLSLTFTIKLHSHHIFKQQQHPSSPFFIIYYPQITTPSPHLFKPPYSTSTTPIKFSLHQKQHNHKLHKKQNENKKQNKRKHKQTEKIKKERRRRNDGTVITVREREREREVRAERERAVRERKDLEK